ncbi:phospholipase D family protein [Gemmobacter sp.]|uniref:phospholipase D family protein n=1 Tax=Gemmobacter sp. TaxID=1898957 RepID=UPI002AFF0CDB|nr:phospholipase D family protein [Gemmobacter sp.]
MFRWLIIAALIAVGGALASVVLAWVYGLFARRPDIRLTHALPPQDGQGPLDDRVQAALAGRPGQTGLVLIAESREALAARIVTARLAVRSLDLLYYTWRDDPTGRLLLAEALAAADRGVRVRLLLDDVGVSNRDEVLQALCLHPQVSVRLFNPARARPGGLRRGVEILLRIVSMTRRMHNKAWIVDGRVAIMGGRNIADSYFDASEQSNFHDLDLLAVGPVVDQAAELFDGFWNSGMAIPIRLLAGTLRDPGRLDALRKASGRPPETGFTLDPARFHWCADARLVADPPDKAAGRKGENWMMATLLPVLQGARHRISITSPYFVPGANGTARLVAIAGRGVDTRVLTNSLAATDVAAVHGGYARYRKALLKAGVALYELRPTARKRRMSFRGKSQASLHTKAFTLDGETGFVGSLNFDPRSASLNTEMGVLFRLPSLVAEMDRLFAEESSGDISYQPRLDDRGRLHWLDDDDGGPEIHRTEPQATPVRRLIAWAVGWLPIESQL